MGGKFSKAKRQAKKKEQEESKGEDASGSSPVGTVFTYQVRLHGVENLARPAEGKLAPFLRLFVAYPLVAGAREALTKAFQELGASDNVWKSFNSTDESVLEKYKIAQSKALLALRSSSWRQDVQTRTEPRHNAVSGKWREDIAIKIGHDAVLLVECRDDMRDSVGKDGLLGSVALLPEWFVPSSLQLSISTTGKAEGARSMCFAAPKPFPLRLCGATGTGAAASGTVELGVTFQESAADTASLARAMEAGAAAATPAKPAGPVAVEVLPHHHTCYCDRVRRVCTAEGAVREGNSLQAHPSVEVGTPASIEWYHSLAEGEDGAEGKEDTLSPAQSLHTFRRIKQTTALEVAHSIPDFPKLNRGMLTKAHASKLFTPALQPLYDGTAAAALMVSEARKAEEDDSVLYLTLNDVGRRIIAVVTNQEGKQFISSEMGPVEPAPPKFRELWIEGTLRVGEWIWCRGWYFGGNKDACEFEWSRISPSGDAVVVKESTPLPKGAPPEITMEVPEEALEGDPRCYKLTEEDLGCHFRVCGIPVSQGAQGSRKASSPTMQPVEGSG